MGKKKRGRKSFQQYIGISLVFWTLRGLVWLDWVRHVTLVVLLRVPVERQTLNAGENAGHSMHFQLQVEAHETYLMPTVS